MILSKRIICVGSHNIEVCIKVRSGVIDKIKKSPYKFELSAIMITDFYDQNLSDKDALTCFILQTFYEGTTVAAIVL